MAFGDVDHFVCVYVCGESDRTRVNGKIVTTGCELGIR